MVQANQSVITDLSKLGKPGDHFVHDFFLPGTQLTFPQSAAAQIAKVDGVASVASGLVLAAVHQEGTVPKIVAKIKTGGDQIQVNRRLTPPTAAEFQKMQACLQKQGITIGAPNGQGGNGQNGQNGLGGGQQPQGGFRAAGGNRDAFAKCLPVRLRRFRATITTPQETLRQVIDPPQTNIKSSSYTIAGVDPKNPEVGVVTSALVTRGRFISPPRARARTRRSPRRRTRAGTGSRSARS